MMNMLALVDASYTAPIFAALGDPYRLSIVARLCEHGPLPTMALQRGLDTVSRQGITKHLRVLEEAGVVQSDRIGRDRQWRLRIERIAQMRDYLRLVSAHWDVRLERLKAMTEADA